MLERLYAGSLATANQREAKIPTKNLEDLIAELGPCLEVYESLKKQNSVQIIAEIKRASPSRGRLAEIPDAAELAASYEAAGADMISVLTEEEFFKGSIEDLKLVNARVSIPVLRKEFIANQYQILEARAYGADVILLIVAGLGIQQITDLYKFAHSIGLSVLVETHSESELDVALELGAKMIGINARDLNTFETDLKLYSQICDKLPSDVVAVAESAVRGVQDVRNYALSGADAVLVGEALVTGDPSQLIPEFKTVQKTRI